MRGRELILESWAVYVQKTLSRTPFIFEAYMDDHIARNFQAFLQQLPNIQKDKGGKYALMRDEKIIEFFDSAPDALKAGELLFIDKLFSIQHVAHRPIDLGFFSHALS